MLLKKINWDMLILVSFALIPVLFIAWIIYGDGILSLGLDLSYEVKVTLFLTGFVIFTAFAFMFQQAWDD